MVDDVPTEPLMKAHWPLPAHARLARPFGRDWVAARFRFGPIPRRAEVRGGSTGRRDASSTASCLRPSDLDEIGHALAAACAGDLEARSTVPGRLICPAGIWMFSFQLLPLERPPHCSAHGDCDVEMFMALLLAFGARSSQRAPISSSS